MYFDLTWDSLPLNTNVLMVAYRKNKKQNYSILDQLKKVQCWTQANMEGKLRHSLLPIYSATGLLAASSFSWSRSIRAVCLALHSKGHTGKMVHTTFLHLWICARLATVLISLLQWLTQILTQRLMCHLSCKCMSFKQSRKQPEVICHGL